MKFNKALIIAAHPDDDILGAGGFMSKFSSSREIRVIFLSEGTSCRFSKEEIIKNKEKVNEETNYRNDCAVEALKVLGISDYHFYNLPCGRLDNEPLIDLNKMIENEISSFEPDIILTHSEDDVNNDHKIVFNSVLTATRPQPRSKLKHLLSFEILSSSEWRFTKCFIPNIFIELTEKDIKRKWEALSKYDTEIQEYPYPRSKKGLEVLANYRGMQRGSEFAEAYRVVRSFL